MEFNGSNGKQGRFYHSKLQGSGSAIPDPNAHSSKNGHGSNSKSKANAYRDSNRNAAT